MPPEPNPLPDRHIAASNGRTGPSANGHSTTTSSNGHKAADPRPAAPSPGLSYRRADFPAPARHRPEPPPPFASPLITTSDTVSSLVGLIEEALPGALVSVDWHAPVAPDYWALFEEPRESAEARVLLCDDDGQLLGRLEVRSPWPEPIDAPTAQMIHNVGQIIASHLADQCRMGQLIRLASTDPLTGLLNRRGFVAHLNDTWRQTHVPRSTAWVLLVDVDGLKQANDRHGHAMGDLLLQDVSSALRAGGSSEGDAFARIGGDEFAALLMDCGTRTDADRFVAAFDRRLECAQEGRPGRVTVSVGACPMTNAGSLHAAMEKADRELYVVKRERAAARETEAAFRRNV